MNELNMVEGCMTMSSREIAELTGKRHDNVLCDIRKMLISIQSPEKLGDYKDAKCRLQPCILLDKNETLCLVSGYSAVLRMKIIVRLGELESAQFKIPQTYSQALQLCADQAAKLEISAPKVAFVDRYVESTGNKTFREVAKILKVNERVFRQFLIENKIQYSLNRSWVAYQNHIDAGRFHQSTGENNGHAFTECRFTPKGVQWVAELFDCIQCK